MTPEFDLGRAADQVAELLPGIDDGHLTPPTPCPDYTVGDLLDHFIGLAGEFARAATKETVALAASGERPTAPGRLVGESTSTPSGEPCCPSGCTRSPRPGAIRTPGSA